jgi:hypothetical protein
VTTNADAPTPDAAPEPTAATEQAPEGGAAQHTPEDGSGTEQAEAPEPAPESAAPEQADAPEPAPESAAPEQADAPAPAPEGAAPERADAPEQTTPQADGDAPASPGPPAAKKPAKPKRRKPPRRPKIPKDLPRTRAALPLDELRDASRATLDLYGRDGVREAFLILAPRERQDISALVAADDDHRPRTRNIANGSLGAGRIDKAMSATIISMARVEDLWAITLDKESAAEKTGRIRAAKQRDRQKAERAKERAERSDRVSREDLEKARDGRVGATIRIVTDDRRERPAKGDETSDEAPKRESVLDRLGY